MTKYFKFKGALLNVSIWKKILSKLVSTMLSDQQNENSRHKHPAERITWFVFCITAVLCTIVFTYDTYMINEDRTVISPETDSYPTQKIDFPAIAICNINRISQKAANHLAQELAEFESVTFVSNLTVQDLTHKLTLLGQLYLQEFKDTETTKLLHMILERSWNNGYNVDRIMKRLTPKCRNMLLKCAWQGKEAVCDDIFILRKTQDGYCCTFNYARRNDGFGSAQDDVFASQYIEHTANIGSEYGLSVLLNPELDDYFYNILPISGFKILLYNPMNHPNVASGQVREVIVSPRTETYMNLNAVLFYTTEDVQSRYDIQKRDCLFQTELSKIFHGYYSFSNCIMDCRIKDISRLCGCVPFFYPITGNIAFTRICNLKDLFCLRKYKEKWQNVKPRIEKVMTPFNESMFEGTDYLSCNCFPSCTDITYKVKSSSIPLSLSELFWERNNYAIKNHSVLHIYFQNLGVVKLRQDVLYYWHDLMNIYVNVWNLFLGVSIINIIEIIYKYILFRSDTTSQSTAHIEEKIKENKDVMQVTTIIIKPAVIPEIAQPLHWEELTGRQQLYLSSLLLNPSSKQ